MDYKTIAEFIQAQGFPIFVSCWLLIQLFAMHDANATMIKELTVELRLLRATIEHGARPALKPP